MNLYNALFGENPYADELLQMVMFTREDFIRYRDIRVIGDYIIVFTRNGKSQREDIKKFIAHIKCIRRFNKIILDIHDPTYAYIQFVVPSKLTSRCIYIGRHQGGFNTVHKYFTTYATDEEFRQQCNQRLEAIEYQRRLKQKMDSLQIHSASNTIGVVSCLDDDY